MLQLELKKFIIFIIFIVFIVVLFRVVCNGTDPILTGTQSLCISYILVFKEHGGISYIVTIGVHNSTINNYIMHANNSISENISSFIDHGSSSATFTDANTNTMIRIVCSYILI
jgi:hypothetical protein